MDTSIHNSSCVFVKITKDGVIINKEIVKDMMSIFNSPTHPVSGSVTTEPTQQM